MKTLLNLFILVSLLAGTTLLSCSDSETRSPLAFSATVIINLGLLHDTDAASASIIDRILRFFASGAVAASTAPAAFSNINIRVTGSGIGTFSKDFPPTRVISMTVPGGGLRLFEVTAQVLGGDSSAGAFPAPTLSCIHPRWAI